MIGRCEMQCDGIRAVVLATAPNDKIQREGQVITPILLEAPDYHHKSREKIYIFSQKKFHYRKKANTWWCCIPETSITLNSKNKSLKFVF